MFDFSKLQQLIEKNSDILDSFFNQNPFNDDFFKRLINNGDKIVNTQATNRKEDKKSRNKSESQQTIPMDLIQRNYELLLIFEIPGLSGKEDIKIKNIGSTLYVEGEIKRNYYLADSDITRFERDVGNFSKKVTLPIIYDVKRIKARYKNGLLEIRIPLLKPRGKEDISIMFPD